LTYKITSPLSLFPSLLSSPRSMVAYDGTGKWSVYYLPHPDASGLDSFSYSASDCPGDITR